MLIRLRRTRRFIQAAALIAVATLSSVATFGSTVRPAAARFAPPEKNGQVAAYAGRARTHRVRRHRAVHKCPAYTHRSSAVHGAKKSRPRHHKPKKFRHRHHTPTRHRMRCVPNTRPRPQVKPIPIPIPTPTPSGATLATPPSIPAVHFCDLYASNSGSDSNHGSQAEPFRSLRKLASSLAAGQIGCLQSGETFDSGEDLSLSPGETHGQEGRPITIASTDPAKPATITHSFALEYGVNYMTITHVDFNWSLPKPWACWNSEGNTIPGQIISGPGKCIPGTASSEDSVQIGMGGKDDSLTYDDITSNDTNICIILGGHGTRWPEGNVFEHDRIHNCGPTVEAATSGFPLPDEEWGWHSHGVYEYGHGTIIKNNYIYDNSRDGVLFYGGGEGAIVEHNILDHNGAGIWFGENNNNRAAWNIITNSTSPRGVADYGIGSYESGSGNVATNNCLDNNESGEIEPGGGFTSTDNKTGANPLYVNAEQHEYALQAGSPCLGYGPDTAQP
jgi:hypothetical protein